MRRTKIFVKISGDIIKRPDVIEWVRSIAFGRNYIVICTGGGSQINEEFKRRGIPPDFGPLGRATKSFEERQIARDVLEKNQAEVQDLLSDNGIHAEVIIPVLDLGTVLCHVNGDILVLAAYHGFDKLFVLTLEGREEKKTEEFGKYPKIEVIGFPVRDEEKIRKAV